MGVEGEFTNNHGGWGMAATVRTEKGPEEQCFQASALLLSPWGTEVWWLPSGLSLYP